MTIAVTNLLTSGRQCAYNNKQRSGQDIIFFIGHKLPRIKHASSDIQGQILRDISRPYGRIDRQNYGVYYTKKGAYTSYKNNRTRT